MYKTHNSATQCNATTLFNNNLRNLVTRFCCVEKGPGSPLHARVTTPRSFFFWITSLRFVTEKGSSKRFNAGLTALHSSFPEQLSRCPFGYQKGSRKPIASSLVQSP